MLVLTRKPQEVIHIGPNITITIVRVSGQSVRVGIDAPEEIRVIRGELAFEPSSAEAAPAVCSQPEGPNEVQEEVPTFRSKPASMVPRMRASGDRHAIRANSTNDRQNRIENSRGASRLRTKRALSA